MDKYKILIVDDNEDNLVITSRLLKKEGYEVSTVSTGFDCLKILKTFKPDLILLDVLLPDINGYEVCRLIKSDIENQDVIIIYFTSVNRSSEVKAEGYQKGADGYITRPISNTELVSIIQAYLKVLKKARELKKSEQRFNFLSDLSFEGLLIHDKKNIIDVNKKLLNMMGFNSVEELPQVSSMIEFVALDSREFVAEKLRQNYEGTYVANLIRKDGSIFPAEINAKNIMINDQMARAVSIRDITERFVLEREVKLALEKAIESSKMKSQFVANVSHEIRTPINSILTITELIKDTPLNKEQLDYIELTKKSAESLLHIVNDILDISKIEAGKLEIENVDFDLYLSLIHI
ncbi:MAG: response regulator [Thermodesulfovibrionales bacterium]|nr:response regulator [Thermodesulfovibrionales bacterium]